MPTTLRRTTLSLPVAPVGPENPLPALAPLDEMHTVDEEERAALPPDMARQVGYAPLRSVLPVRVLDGYTRRRTPASIDALVLENDRLRVTVLPGLGGRIHSLHHKPTGRELLYTNPVFQPADFALNGAWYSGGIEWNIGATGHTTLSVAPVHAARVPAPDGWGPHPAAAGGEMLRLWEWERLRDTPFQVDLWLPDGSDFLYVGVRIRNPHDRAVPVYWWSNIAVPEDEGTRVLVPADETWYFAYERRLRRIPVPEWDGVDRSYALRSEFPADYFYEIPREERKWIASLDDRGTGLVQTSTSLLRGRKLFVWGHGPGGRRWQEWLTEPGTQGYAEIQAGLARTQLEHVPLDAGREFAWLEAYGPLSADPAAVHGGDWAAAREHTAARLEEALPAADVDAAFAAWRPYADTEPDTEADIRTGAEPGTGALLAVGSGWGALEVARAGYELPGTPFPAETMGEQQRPWMELLTNGRLLYDAPSGTSAASKPASASAPSPSAAAPASPRPERPAPACPTSPPGPSLVSDAWRDQLECAPSGPLTDYHLGVAQWHAGDRAQAVRSWERSVSAAPTAWSLRCLGFADAYDAATGAHPERAADRYLAALDLASGGELPALAALVREAVPVLLAAGRPAGAAEALDRLPPEYRDRGRFQLLCAQVLLAQGEREAARALFDAGFEVDDLREGDEVLGDTWAELSDDPLPARYDFRMRPA
ncbi:DUF5107 domain-containing protein [Streptomyces marispadix]|uniref:DUF5107 domain-containing protein n=1 Tax=Streptomyces marispadix TaxID=2922868 RepID=A0ABS9T4I3_9ACTN|nr:DUF5107 domain-containing protein [Streptomyces marispadix]MCH6163420.1 DUF5107 domain-containing protein [Streptomyces marispadix]